MLELLDTERRYVALITLLIRQFLQPLLLLTHTEQEQFLTEEEVHSIFLNVNLLHSYNMIFLSNLTKRVHEWSDTQLISDVFLLLPDFLNAYGQYLQNYDSAMALLRHCLKDQSFELFVQTLAASPNCEGLGLEDFLMLPYQRITAYAHILQKLARWTWESHKDFEGITAVLNAIEEVLINNAHTRVPDQEAFDPLTKLGARDAFLKLVAVHDLLVGCPIDITTTPGRQYICEARVTLLDEIASRQRGWIYLFNDALLTTTELEAGAMRKKFHVHKDLQDFCSFIPLEDIMTIDEAREYSTIVKVTCREGRIITIKFDSSESKSAWLSHFVAIVAAHRQRTAHFAEEQGQMGDKVVTFHGITSEESEFESF